MPRLDQQFKKLIAETSVNALAITKRDRDTSCLSNLINILGPRRWGHLGGVIQKCSPLRIETRTGKKVAKFRKPEYPPFNLEAAASSLGLDRWQIWSNDQFRAKLQEIDSRLNGGGRLSESELRKLAIDALRHAQDTGDVSPCQRVFEKVGEAPDVSKWFTKFGPIITDIKPWKLRGGWQRLDFDVDSAKTARIIWAETNFDLKNLFSDDGCSQWMQRISEAHPLELISAVQKAFRLIVRGEPNESSAARRVRDAVEAEWRRRTEYDEFFKWPKSYVLPGAIELETINAPERGIFSALGYRVGTVSGEPDEFRHLVLDYLYSHVLPPMNGPLYMRKWGLPATSRRLQSMAYFIARMCWNAQRSRTRDFSRAISDWVCDLDYLRHTYYEPRFRFTWPEHSGDGIWLPLRLEGRSSFY